MRQGGGVGLHTHCRAGRPQLGAQPVARRALTALEPKLVLVESGQPGNTTERAGCFVYGV